MKESEGRKSPAGAALQWGSGAQKLTTFSQNDA